MAKKSVKPVSDDSVIADEKVSNEKDVAKEPKAKKQAKTDKTVKVERVSKSKPKKEKKSLKKKAQEVMSELKKVSKPSFGKVCKNTCVVISVVVICTLFLFGIDRLFGWINSLLLP